MPGLSLNFGGRPKQTRKRLTPREETEKQNAERLKLRLHWLKQLRKENPVEFQAIMRAELEADMRRRGVLGGDDGETVDPIEAGMALIERFAKIRDLIPGGEPRSEMSELIHTIGDAAAAALKNPAVGAMIVQAVGPRPANGVIDHQPSAIPMPAVAPVPTPAPTEPPAAAPIAPAPETAAPALPLDRFLPLLDRPPDVAAALLLDQADADEAAGDNSLWQTIESVCRAGPELVLVLLRGYQFDPHYRDVASRLLSKSDWTRALVGALISLTSEDEAETPAPAAEPENVVSIPAPKKGKKA